MAAPTLVSHGESTLADGKPRSVSGIAVQSGDLIVVVALGDGDLGNITLSNPGTGVTWTQRVAVRAGDSFDSVTIWTGAITSTGTLGFELTYANAAVRYFGFSWALWRNHGGIGATPAGSSNAGSAPSYAITTVGADSALVMGVADWNVTGGVRTPRAISGATVTALDDWTDWYTAAYIGVGAAGSKTVGMTSPTGQKPALGVIEILAGSAGITYQVVGTTGATSATSGTLTLTGESTGITAAITTAIGVPTSYQKINATTIGTTTTNGSVISYNKITGNFSIVSNAVGGPSSYQEINAVDVITTTIVGSTVFKGQAQGTQSLVSEISGDVSVVGGSITYPITGNIPITTETNASPSTRSVVLGSVSIQSQISGAISVTGVPIWDVAGTVVLTSGTSATVVQHTALTGTVPVATTISGTITARSIITSLVSVLSGIIGNTNVISAVAGSSASTATVSGTVRIFGGVGLPQTMTLNAQVSSVHINGSSPKIVLSEDEQSIVLQARYNEITLEAH